MAASLRAKMALARAARRRAGQARAGGAVRPRILGHAHTVYFAYVAAEERDSVRVLGPESSGLGLCETRMLSGVFRALRLWRNVVGSGWDERGWGSGVGSCGMCWGGLLGMVVLGTDMDGDMDMDMVLWVMLVRNDEFRFDTTFQAVLEARPDTDTRTSFAGI